MFVIASIKEGFGNRVWMLAQTIQLFRSKYMGSGILCVVEQASRHDKGFPEESMKYVFPSLTKLKWLKFIGWKEYDILRQDPETVVLQPSFEFSYDVFDSFIKKHFVLNPVFDKVFEKYDTRKGTAIHIRLGDKFKLNYRLAKKGSPPSYALPSPTYYADHAKNGPIYVFTDSPDIVECVFMESLPVDAILVKDEPFWNVFALFTKFRHIIVSDSTLVTAARYWNRKDTRAVAPMYRSWEGELKISPLLNPDLFVRDNRKDIILRGSDYIEIHKRCM
jgi:hypothetical protein